jgi:dTDP-4-amino-4,6-dideoxygalactose transaminase
LAAQGLMTLPTVPAHCDTNYHMFYIVLNDLATRSALISHLKQASILGAFHYVPLHTAPVGRQLGYRAGILPVTEYVSDRLLRLPLFAGLTAGETADVVEHIRTFFAKG